MERSKAAPAARPSQIGLDFHSHLLPQVDDGMPSYDDAKLAIERLQGLGFRGAVLTPHLYRGVFDNDAAGLRHSFGAFVDALRKDGIAFSLHLAGEYFADEHFLKLIEAGDLLYTPLGQARLVLLEFSYLQETPFITPALSALVAKGFRPIIAHVERYRFVGKKPEAWLECFARYGAILQGDIGSLAGQHGEGVQRFARWLLDRGHISIWGTDLHNPRQVGRHISAGLTEIYQTGQLSGALNPMLTGMAI